MSFATIDMSSDRISEEESSSLGIVNVFNGATLDFEHSKCVE